VWLDNISHLTFPVANRRYQGEGECNPITGCEMCISGHLNANGVVLEAVRG